MIESKDRKTAGKSGKVNAGRPAPAKAPETRTAGTPERRGILPPEERWRMIAEAAYYRALRRGFTGGTQDQDWRDAEAEIDALLLRDRASRP